MKLTRKKINLVLILLVGAVLVYSFWPRPILVHTGQVEQRSLSVAIKEEGRTRVHDLYQVSAPRAGRLARIEIEVGTQVVAGKTVLARLAPPASRLLDARQEEQAHAERDAAKAALRLAEAERERVTADRQLAERQLERFRKLISSGIVSQADLDRAVREALSTEALVRNAEAVIAVRKAELKRVQVLLKSFDSNTGEHLKNAAVTEIVAPINGRVLRILQQSEALLTAGSPILEIGNIDSDLEVVVELLSSDAVQVAPGQSVTISDWGGGPLFGTVARVEPFAFTKISALGVEEQRVNTIITFNDDRRLLEGLGHGYRVEATIRIWENSNALVIPSSALFRTEEDWTVFVVEQGRLDLRQVSIGHNNGIDAELLSGLFDGERVVLFPAAGLSDGARVAEH